MPIPSLIDVGDSNDSGTKVQISQEPVFDFVFDEEEEVQKQGQFEYFYMFFEDEESSRSQHSTSKPKQKKKKKAAMSRKEFLNLKSKIHQILSVVSSLQPPQTPPPPALQSFEERLAALKQGKMDC